MFIPGTRPAWGAVLLWLSVSSCRSSAGTPLPVGWGYPTEYMVKMGRLAVDSKVFPLYEVYDGVQYNITLEPKGNPVREYLKLQNRFRYLNDDEVEWIQKNVDKEWSILTERTKMGITPAGGKEKDVQSLFRDGCGARLQLASCAISTYPI